MLGDLILKVKSFANLYNLIVEFDYSVANQLGFALYNQQQYWGYKRIVTLDEVSQFVGTPDEYFDMVIESTYEKISRFL